VTLHLGRKYTVKAKEGHLIKIIKFQEECGTHTTSDVLKTVPCACVSTAFLWTGFAKIKSQPQAQGAIH
jgi:hypothetical protein